MEKHKNFKIFAVKEIRQKKTFLCGSAVVSHAVVGYVWEVVACKLLMQGGAGL